MSTPFPLVVYVSRSNGDLLYMPELMRIRGDILSEIADEHGAEDCFRRSIELADRQSALSWRLRTVVSLARLKLRQGRPAEAKRLVAETYWRFTEGFGTADLTTAKLLLQETGKGVAR
jgi:predicted ATPase